MKNFKIISICFLGFLMSSCSQDNSTQKELVEIKKILIEINQKLGDSKKLNENKSNNLSENYRASLLRKIDRPNLEKLNEISLPDNPTKDQITEYIRKIEAVSATQTSYSDADPQIFMLERVGNKNLELLLKENLDSSANFYAIIAVINLAEEKDKELILKYLPFKKELVKVVIKKGWEKDARIILYDELRQIPEYLPAEWIQAIANLQEECIYEDLKQYMIFSSNKARTYEAIRRLPGIDLDDAVKQAWENAKQDEWSRNSFAPIALAYGQNDALEMVVESLDSSPNDYNVIRYPRKYILQYTYASGSNRDLQDWYNKNKDRLYFDKEKKKYIVKGDEHDEQHTDSSDVSH